MKKALLLTLRNSDFTEMFRLANALKEHGQWDPMILTYSTAGNDVSYQKEKCADAGINLTITQESSFSDVIPLSYKRKKSIIHLNDGWLRDRVMPLVWKIGTIKQKIFSYFRIFNYAFLFSHQIRMNRRIIQQFKPDILVLAEDIVGLTLPAFIKIGHDNSIPCVIAPYTICNALEAAESLYVQANYRVDNLFSRIMAALFPAWVYEYKNTKLLRLPSYYIFAHKLFRLTPPDPWTMNSGYANAIAIESAHMKEYYMREGFLDEKLCVTGAIYDDTLARVYAEKKERMARLCEQNGFSPDKPLIVVGAPPNQLATPRPECVLKTYDEVMETLARSLARYKDKWNIIIRPHPNFMDIEKHFSPFGLKVTKQDTAELVPLADIFIAYASATIRWAISCGIPTINYDVFQYRYDDYKTAPGVLHAYVPEEFDSLLEKLTNDPKFYEDVHTKQRSVMNDWGHTDGKSTERMIGLFDKLIAQKPVRRTPTTRFRGKV